MASQANRVPGVNDLSVIGVYGLLGMVGNAFVNGFSGPVAAAIAPLFKSQVLSSIVPGVVTATGISVAGGAAGGLVAGLIVPIGFAEIRKGRQGLGAAVVVAGIAAGFFVSLVVVKALGHLTFDEALIYTGYQTAISLGVCLIGKGVYSLLYSNKSDPDFQENLQRVHQQLLQEHN